MAIFQTFPLDYDFIIVVKRFSHLPHYRITIYDQHQRSRTDAIRLRGAHDYNVRRYTI